MPPACVSSHMMSHVTRPLHRTFPAGSGARAHGLRAKAGARFLSFFLSDGVKDVREWMAAAYKPELAATLIGSCMQDSLHCLKAGLEGQPNVTPAS